MKTPVGSVVPIHARSILRVWWVLEKIFAGARICARTKKINKQFSTFTFHFVVKFVCAENGLSQQQEKWTY